MTVKMVSPQRQSRTSMTSSNCFRMEFLGGPAGKDVDDTAVPSVGFTSRQTVPVLSSLHWITVELASPSITKRVFLRIELSQFLFTDFHVACSFLGASPGCCLSFVGKSVSCS